jgi:hypothetical protein
MLEKFYEWWSNLTRAESNAFFAIAEVRFAKQV